MERGPGVVERRRRVVVRTLDGKRHELDVETDGVMGQSVKRDVCRALGVEEGGWRIRWVRGREVVDETLTVRQLNLESVVFVPLPLLDVRPANAALAAAVTAEEIARATGGPMPPPPAARPEARDVQRRIRGFMTSLFEGVEEEAAEGGVGEPGEEEDEEHDEEQDEEEEERRRGGGGAVDAGPAAGDVALGQLTGMGFSVNAARKALIVCRGNPELAMDWILEHAGDANLDNEPTPEELAALRRGGARVRPRAAEVRVDPVVAARLVEMGFGAEQVADALRSTRNNEQAAVAVLLGDGPPAAGGAGGAPDLPEPPPGLLNNPVLRAMLMHPGIQDGLRNPRVLEAFRAIMENPASAPNFLDDPEVGPVLLQVNEVLQEVPQPHRGRRQEDDEDEEGEAAMRDQEDEEQ